MNPDDIARRTFPAVRKGIDPDAVRRYLELVADEVRAAHDREAVLRRRVVEAERKAAEPPVLDEATLSAAVGAETARVLQSAHDAAREVVGRAEAWAADLVAAAESQLEEQTAAAAEEAGRLLEAARAEAAEAAEAVREEVEGLREAAEAEAEATVAAAQNDAVALLDTTKQRCRRTVGDARRLRKQVLSDLVERRRSLFVQLEQLRSGRDSLVEVVEAVEQTVADLKARLDGAEFDARIAAAEAGDRAEEVAEEEAAVLLEPDALFEEHAAALGEDSGEPAEPAAGVAVATAAETVVDLGAHDDLSHDEEDEARAGEVRAEDTAASHRSVGELFARIRAARESPARGVAGTTSPDEGGPAGPDTPAGPETAAGPDTAGPDTAGPENAAGPDTGTARGTGEGGSDAPAPAEGGEVSAGEDAARAAEAVEAVEDVAEVAGGGPGEAPETTGGEDPADSGPHTEVLPAVVPESSDGDGDGRQMAGGDSEALRRRDEILGPVVAKLSRVLKRALQDDQNELLTAIRRASGAPQLEALLPEAEQRGRFAEAAAGALADGWRLGRTWLRPGDAGGNGSPTEEAAAVGQALGEELSGELSGLLRHRISESLRSIGEVSEGAQDAAGAAYREWKGPRVEGIAGDFATRAFGRGAVSAAAGAPVRWVVDDGVPCPDCDDNALAGEQPAGEEWPTGQVHPPVHPGCRCLLVATSG